MLQALLLTAGQHGDAKHGKGGLREARLPNSFKWETLFPPSGSTSAMGYWECWITCMGPTSSLSRPRPMRDMSSCWASPHFQRASPILPRRWGVRLDHPNCSLTSRRCGDCLGAMLPLTCLLWLPYSRTIPLGYRKNTSFLPGQGHERTHLSFP